MKTNRRKILRVILALAIAVVVCVAVFALFDNVLNGVLRSWFAREFTYTYDRVLPESGETVLVEAIHWTRLEGAVLAVVSAAVVVWILTLALADRFARRKQREEQFREMSAQIDRIIRREPEDIEMVPEEYGRIADRIERMKTMMRRNEQILKDEARQKNDLITYLAHDLKTPLTSVIGYLSLLDEAEDMPADQRQKYVRITLDKAVRLEGLINEFFDITRYNLSQMVLERETIDLYYMLAQMAEEFYPILQAHGNTAVLDAPEDLTVYADPDKLARVFHNILKNAVAYSYADTPVKIRAKRTAQGVCVTFSNRGKTIPEQKLARLFDKFFRLDEARSSNSGGAGLGLAIAREIVNLHGGTISAESADEQTVFTVVLP